MKEKSASSKKKRVTYYLVLAACLLAVAGIAVGIVFGVRANTQISSDPIIEKPNDGDTDTPPVDDTPTTPDDGNVNTNTATEFIMPITNINMSQAYVFWHDATLDRYCLHQGVDFSAAVGTEVYAAVDGTVKEVSVRDVFYGGTVTISHTNGLETVYRFIDVADGLAVGNKVSRGDKIGTVAEPVGIESEVGSHLHFEVHSNGSMVDPDDYLNLTEK